LTKHGDASKIKVNHFDENMEKEKSMLRTFTTQSEEIQHLITNDPILGDVIKKIGTLTYTTDEGSLEFFVDTIVSQMLSNKAANAIFARLKDICGGEITAVKLEPFSISDLRDTGLSERKAGYIIGLAKHFRENPDYFDTLAGKSDKEVMNKLTKLRGIGPWTAKMYLIFVLDRPDILPFEDGAFQQAFRWAYPDIECNEKNMKEVCSPWHPYASIASRYLYWAVDSGLTKPGNG